MKEAINHSEHLQALLLDLRRGDVNKKGATRF